jgi:hypothetical protein
VLGLGPKRRQQLLEVSTCQTCTHCYLFSAVWICSSKGSTAHRDVDYSRRPERVMLQVSGQLWPNVC